MKLELYEDIITSIRNFRGLSKDCVKMLIEKYSNVSQQTLYSIIALEVTQKMIVRHRKLFGGDKNYYLRYLQAVKAGKPFGILLRLAQEIDAPPALLARSVLDKYCEATMPNVPRSEISKLLKDTTLIEDGQLSLEIYTCLLKDDQYGCISDTFGNSIGVEFEYKLQSLMTEKNLAFHNEEYLRSRGYDKTPDFKLEIPIMVNGFIVHWIESKARFGSPEVHQKYVKEQFLSYWNRFGTGLVIYWYGYVDTLNNTSEKRFILLEDFPKEFTAMNPKCIQPSIS